MSNLWALCGHSVGTFTDESVICDGSHEQPEARLVVWREYGDCWTQAKQVEDRIPTTSRRERKHLDEEVQLIKEGGPIQMRTVQIPWHNHPPGGGLQ